MTDDYEAWKQTFRLWYVSEVKQYIEQHTDQEHAEIVVVAKEILNEYYASKKWVYLEVSRGRDEVEPYLGFGAEFMPDSSRVVRVPEEHVEWLRGRLASGLIGTRVIEEG